MARWTLGGLAVACSILGLSAASLAADSSKTGAVKVFLKPCCSTIAVHPGSPPPHYGPRSVELRDQAGTKVVKQKVPMRKWTVLSAPVGKYRVVSRGCSSARVSITTSGHPRVKLTCPVP